MRNLAMLDRSRYAAALRRELCMRNASYATSQQLPHVKSYGELPVVVYFPSPCGTKHGNFISPSYRAIMRRPEWKKRLAKVHAQASRALPKADLPWKELDSSTSSDALLMNIFCYPGIAKRRELHLLLGTEPSDVPSFGFKPRTPLINGFVERTEADMKMGNVMFEAKLTESDFQCKNAAIVEGYRDLHEVFDLDELPRRGEKYASYQLLRNVLAAHDRDLSFCLLLDARRPDLMEDWYCILRCIRILTLRERCRIVTWQAIARFLSLSLRAFLDDKYGIMAEGE